MKDTRIDNEQFRPRTYGLQELALLYFPGSTPRSASSQLKRWINHGDVLLSALRAVGYYRGQKILTPKQVRVIVEYLDPP